jgi:hypothetical protein
MSNRCGAWKIQPVILFTLIDSRYSSWAPIRATLLGDLRAWRHNLLYAPHFPGLEPHLDAMGVVGRFREDVAHDAASELPAPLILLLRDAHLEPWCNVCPMLPVHVVLTSFPFGSGRNASSAEWTM